MTYAQSCRRSFEVSYWKTIALLAEGRFLNKNNADCVRDAQTQKRLHHHQRDLDHLGDFLIQHHSKSVAAHGMTGLG